MSFFYALDHCMVSFVKPSLLGTRREFGNRFVNPITNGQHADSTARDVKIMKRRAHVLHEMLQGCVQVGQLLKFAIIPSYSTSRHISSVKDSNILIHIRAIPIIMKSICEREHQGI